MSRNMVVLCRGKVVRKIECKHCQPNARPTYEMSPDDDFGDFYFSDDEDMAALVGKRVEVIVRVTKVGKPR